MKKLFFLIALFAITVCATAQITVLSNGNVGIKNSTPAYSLDLLYGSARFGLYGANSPGYSLHFNGDNKWGAPQIISYGAQLLLGNENNFVNGAYVTWFYYKNMYKYSDERLKENIKPLGSTLKKILEIEGKSYKYKKEFLSS